MGKCANPIFGSAQQYMNQGEISCLCDRGCAWGGLRKDRTRGRNNVFWRRHRSNRIENGDAQGSFRLEGDLMAKMTVRATRIMRSIVMMPVADDSGGKNQ
jgi:hypothetical protein